MINEFQLVGNVVRTYVGDNVATVTLAVRRGYKAKDAEEYASDFFTVTFFDEKRFDFIEKQMEKGSFAITGYIQGERPRKDGEGYEEQQLVGRSISFANGGNLASFQIAGNIGRVFDNSGDFATSKIYIARKINEEKIYDTYSVNVNGIFAKHMIERNDSKQGVVVSGTMTTYKKEVTENGKSFNKTFLSLNQKDTSWGNLRHEDEAAEAETETTKEKPKGKPAANAKPVAVEPEVEAEANDDLPF